MQGSVRIFITITMMYTCFMLNLGFYGSLDEVQVEVFCLDCVCTQDAHVKPRKPVRVSTGACPSEKSRAFLRTLPQVFTETEATHSPAVVLMVPALEYILQVRLASGSIEALSCSDWSIGRMAWLPRSTSAGQVHFRQGWHMTAQTC